MHPRAHPRCRELTPLALRYLLPSSRSEARRATNQQCPRRRLGKLSCQIEFRAECRRPGASSQALCASSDATLTARSSRVSSPPCQPMKEMPTGQPAALAVGIEICGKPAWPARQVLPKVMALNFNVEAPSRMWRSGGSVGVVGMTIIVPGFARSSSRVLASTQYRVPALLPPA